MRTPAHLSLIEPLEARIAPAAVLTALSYSSKTTDAKSGLVLQFIPTNAAGLSPANQAIANVVGASPNVYFIKVGPGDDVRIPTNVGFADLVNVTKGTVVAFFTDSNTDGVPQANELTGLALGNKVSVSIGTDVHGDIVTNYNDATGSLGGSGETSGSAVDLLPNSITSLVISGSVTGALVSGGSVSRFISPGAMNEVLTGNAAGANGGYTYNFDMGTTTNPAGETLTGGAAGAPLAGVAGPSFSNATFGSLGTMHLGDGGAGAKGGSISNITLRNDTAGFLMQAGAGGSATGVHGNNGGAGGSISDIIVNGPLSNIPDPTPNSIISLVAGAGGAGFNKGRGGAGGSASGIYVDYNSASVNDPAASLLADNVLVQGGVGGSGLSGGAGGSLSNVHSLTSTPHDLTPNAIEFQFLAGKGGAASGGTAGKGGLISTSSIQNLDSPTPIDPATGLPDDTAATSPTHTLALLKAGDGGADTGAGKGAAGGNISNLTLKGFAFEVQAGIGSSGIAGGGAGGSISSVNVLGSVGDIPGDNIHAQDLQLMAGGGGGATSGKGAAGGGISNVVVSNADFGDPTLAYGGLQVFTGAGGTGGKGAGGKGGSLTNLQVTSVDFGTLSHPLGNTGIAHVAMGGGGAGSNAGGAGGSISNFTLVGTRLEVTGITAGKGGAGGSNAVKGKGGAGGSLTNVAVNTSEYLVTSTTTPSSGLLLDTNQDFVADGVSDGDTVINETAPNTPSTTVTSVSSTELGLASDIFATGDFYEVDAASNNAVEATGIAQASQPTLIDATENFPAMAVTVGDVVENLTSTAANGGIPVTAEVTSIISPTELGLNGDIMHVGDQYSIFSQGHLTAGDGGAGNISGAGGKGGSISGGNLSAPGILTLQAGSGGSSGTGATGGAAGGGGSLIGASAFSTIASASAHAGNAGLLGAKAGAGGSISAANLQAFGDISFIAGNGTAGGAGGSINQHSGYSGPLQSSGFVPSSGNVTVQAGNGGDSTTKSGGAGGSISSVTGFVTNGQFDPTSSFTTVFTAGTGGDGISKAGAGGSINGISIFGGGGFNVAFYLDAGDAGNATTAKTGATGGSISNISGGAEASDTFDPVFSIDPGTNFHHLSAGDGGNTALAAGKGGLGGSVSAVHVNGTIGQRTGENFGFALDEMGGISAGAGGTGGKAPGLAGSVTNISADAIASIVAGHQLTNSDNPLLARNLVNKVDNIKLNGLNSPTEALFPFTLTFGGDTTPILPGGDSSADVSSAVNALPSVTAAGGAGVTKTPNGGYLITFADNGQQANFSGQELAPVADKVITPGNATTMNVQEVTTLGKGTFTLSYNNMTTAPLQPDASTGAVMSALSSIGATTTVQNGPYGPSDYIVTFTTDGPKPAISGTETIPLTVQNNGGSATTPDSETISFPVAGALDTNQFQTANLVGGIANVNRPNSATFAFTNHVGGPGFDFGDSPIDGLIAAVDLTANKNFVPEAFVTADASGHAVLVDNLNS